MVADRCRVAIREAMLGKAGVVHRIRLDLVMVGFK